jgi:hypothetical protein
MLKIYILLVNKYIKKLCKIEKNYFKFSFLISFCLSLTNIILQINSLKYPDIMSLMLFSLHFILFYYIIIQNQINNNHKNTEILRSTVIIIFLSNTIDLFSIFYTNTFDYIFGGLIFFLLIPAHFYILYKRKNKKIKS